VKIYLAGKIAKSDWRHVLVPALRGAHNKAAGVDRWGSVPMAYGLEYVGPYFVSCDHGCAHGGEHAWIGGGCIASPYDLPSRRTTAQLCRDAIRRCDVFFVWMDGAETAHGTLVEIGLAHAYGKPIILADKQPPEPVLCEYCRFLQVVGDQIADPDRGRHWDGQCECQPYNQELWFAYQHATRVIHSDSAPSAFAAFIRRLKRAGFP